jgi:hypothetical protein
MTEFLDRLLDTLPLLLEQHLDGIIRPARQLIQRGNGLGT